VEYNGLTAGPVARTFLAFARLEQVTFRGLSEDRSSSWTEQSWPIVEP